MRLPAVLVPIVLLSLAQPPAFAQQFTPSVVADASAEGVVRVTDEVVVPGSPLKVRVTKEAVVPDAVDITTARGQFVSATTGGSALGTFEEPRFSGQLETSSGSTSASASASADYGTLRASATGSAVGDRAETVSSRAFGSAAFTDFIVLSGTGSIAFEIGFGLDSALSQLVNGDDSGASASAALFTRIKNERTGQEFSNTIINSTIPANVTPQTLLLQLVALPGDTIQILGRLSAAGGAGTLDGSASFSANASNTAETFIRLVTPGSGYTAASGTVYRTDFSSTVVPLPAAGWLLLSGMGLFAARARSRRETTGMR